MKIFGILLFLVSYNCFSEPLTVTYPDGVSITLGDTQPLSEKVDELNKCIKKVKAANTQYKKNRKSKGPLSKLVSVVDKSSLSVKSKRQQAPQFSIQFHEYII